MRNYYFYLRDYLQNILGIVDQNGKLVVKYNYDAYGNIKSISDVSGGSIGKLNPFRYKGYYYDDDTDMYYCKSRFYVPKWRRWLNSDSIDYLEPQNITCLNLFAYCNNNPVMYVDENGNMPKWVQWLCWGLAAAAVIGTGVALIVASGGSLVVAGTAAMSAACGVASTSTALTVTSFAFVGSSLGFIGASMFAARSDDMLNSGPSVLFSTVTGGLYGGITGYAAYQEQIGHNQSWTTIRRNYWKSKGYDSAPDGGDGHVYVLNHPYGRYGTKINIYEEMTHIEHVQFHRIYGYGRGTGGFNRYYPFSNPWKWLNWL